MYIMKKAVLLLSFICMACASHAQLQWQRCLGGSSDDAIKDVRQVADGGYIAAGVTGSTDGDVAGKHGNYDAWIVKLSSTGSVEWQKCFGGSGDEGAGSIQQTADEGFIFVGSTSSSDGDVSGLHASADHSEDCWVVKLSAAGELQWQRCLGGSKSDGSSAVRQTADGGYIVAGSTYSADGDVTGQHGGDDAWVVKLTATGDIEWQKTLGGKGDEYAMSVSQTFDGGYIFTGTTTSADGDVAGQHGESDMWVVKLSATGSLEWQRALGGTSEDAGYSIQQTMDSGYIVTGSTESIDGDIDIPGATYWRYNYDLWVVKLSPAGAIQWSKAKPYNNQVTEIGHSICQTADTGYILCGLALHFIILKSGQPFTTREDLLVVRLSVAGDIKWEWEYGGTPQSLENGASISPASDGGYIISGIANSNNGDVSGNHGGGDGWVIKIGDKPSAVPDMPVTPELALAPNPASDELEITASAAITRITITNPLGQTVRTLACHTTQLRVDIAGLAPGQYFVRVNNTEVRRFVKQ